MPVGRTSRRRSERGASLIELALILPILALIVFGIIEFGLIFSEHQNLRQAVREGARTVTVNPTRFVSGGTFSASTFRAFIANEADLPDNAKLHISWAPSGSAVDVGDDITVCAVYDLESRTALFSPIIEGRQLRAVAHMRFEQESVTMPPPTADDPDAPPCSSTPTAPAAANPCASDSTGPTGTFSIASSGGAQPGYTNNANLSLQLNHTDPNAPLLVQFSDDGTTYDPYISYSSSFTRPATAGDGSKTVWVRVKDSCNNEAAPQSFTIFLDRAAPAPPALTITGTTCPGGNNRNISLAWSAATDPAPASGVNRYVWTATYPPNGNDVGIETTTSDVYAGQRNRDVTISVVAIDNAGNSSGPSNTVSKASGVCT